MATDLETSTNEGETPQTRPSLKITRLHIKGLKSIGSLDLPEDGLGWGGEIPDFVMVGGINGSGKTTLLEFLVSVFSLLGTDFRSTRFENIPPELRARMACVDIRVSVPEFADFSAKLLIGDTGYIYENADGVWFGIEYGTFFDKENRTSRFKGNSQEILNVASILKMPSSFLKNLGLPSIVYFRSERRSLVSFSPSFKSASSISDDYRFLNIWEVPDKWDNSLEARLYGLRWEDLNAKEEGRPEDATHFRAYQLAFERFFDGRKQIRWTPKGELVVETKSGAIHDLSELSSGEKQVILFMGELLHRWHPGSIILIDEPELHLHESYQTRLWEALVDWQKERGGQVILATQSAHLFGLSGPGTRVILSGRSR